MFIGFVCFVHGILMNFVLFLTNLNFNRSTICFFINLINIKKLFYIWFYYLISSLFCFYNLIFFFNSLIMSRKYKSEL